MSKLIPIAVTDIATNIQQYPAFMSIVINDRKYSTARKRTPFILKALSEGAAAHGRLTITTNRLSLADEYGQTFQTLAPLASVITSVDLGLFRSRIREIGPNRRTKARYTLVVKLVTPTTTYQLFNTDLAVIAPLVAWTRAYGLSLGDPLQLATTSFDLTRLTIPEFESLTRGTDAFAWCQTVGAR
ncbi:hypothetical protein [Lactiplantibacillus carotarum]|uniref:hypothetical protein n=1 Tax=Lactiplantibacillus carotarum TaxID=2993456 RepID=UPI00298EDD21|nr:hypothetical protein [Lactiplantibacillus carotarum]